MQVFMALNNTSSINDQHFIKFHIQGFDDVFKEHGNVAEMYLLSILVISPWCHLPETQG